MALSLVLGGCGTQNAGVSEAVPRSSSTALCEPSPTGPGVEPQEKADRLSPSRLLRRASLALRGVPPTDDELATQEGAGDEAAQLAYVDSFVDQALLDGRFYRTMFELGREWLNLPLVPSTADAPEYGAEQQRSLTRCAAGTTHAGAWHYSRERVSGEDVCGGTHADGSAAEVLTLEPWWAPGTEVTVVGDAASTTAQALVMEPTNGNTVLVDCNGRPEGSCGCGPNAVRCHADFQQYPGHEEYVHWNENGQRRLLSEEPARLFAHLAWHDRPATDLILESYSVGPTNLQAAYVMQGIEAGDLALLSDDSWWRPSLYAAAPVDPNHEPGDPLAWREFQIPAVNPVLLADRDYKFDPRTQSGMLGIPAAGMLTSPGFLDALPRERLRAARALENLACEVLAPPIGLAFNEYERDPYSEGPCQHCHTRIDPAAIHFKRWAKQGSAFEGWGARYLMPGIGNVGQFDKAWRTGVYPFGGDPYSHWNRWYVHDTGMTPVTQAQIDADPAVVFIDFLPPEQTLLGQKGDGTVGPLGFAKIIVAAGAFDRCLVRKLHQQVLGRDLDPGSEAGYLDALTASFLGGERKIRPFLKSLTQSELFRRGL
jgi:hypothetical protein